MTEAHHQIIYDQDQVTAFLKQYIPLDEEHFCISLMLFARRKYCKTLPSSEYILSRTFIPGGTRPEAAMRKLWRQHVPIGCYVDSNDCPIPNEALCVYAVLKPKDTLKALSATTKECMDALIDGKSVRDPYGSYAINIGKADSSSPHQRYKYTQIDLDTKEPIKLKQCCVMLRLCGVNDHITSITETRGGFHIVYRKHDSIDHRRLHDYKLETVFYKTANDGQSVKDYWFSQTNQPLVVVPGTLQGGFPARAWSVADFCSIDRD